MKKLFLMMSAVLLLSIPASARNLWMVGDGSMAQYNDSVGAAGWVQNLESSLKKNVKLANDAALGMNIRAFIKADAFKQIKKKPNGTILFIQFGTNDLKEHNLDQYSSLDTLTSLLMDIIDYAEKKKVKVVLCTPMAHPYYYNGELIDRLGAYPEAIRRVGEFKNIPVFDLERLTHDWLASMTEEEAAEYFVTLDKTQLVEGEYQLNGMGAAVVAEMVKQSLLKHPYKKLRKLVKK